MPFPVTYLLDQEAPSETFIRREIDQLRRRDWPIVTHYLTGSSHALKYALSSCPVAYRGRFLHCALTYVISIFFKSPLATIRILKRLPQAAHLVSLLTENGSQLLHAQFAGITADISAIAAQTVGIHWTCSVHARDVFISPPALLKQRMQHADGIIACSQKAANCVVNAGISNTKISLIHHGLPLHDFAFDTIQPDGVVLFVGRLDEKKGVDVLLHACSHVLKQNSEFTCLIAGDGPNRSHLQRLSDQLGLNEVVTFLGWQSPEEIRSLIMDASLLVLPSRQLPNGDCDGIANVIVEALALGTPVLTTFASAAPEVITDQVNGLLVPPDDPLRLAHAIDQALHSKDLLLNLSRTGRKTAEELFDLSINCSQIETFFQQHGSQASPPAELVIKPTKHV